MINKFQKQELELDKLKQNSVIIFNFSYVVEELCAFIIPSRSSRRSTC